MGGPAAVLSLAATGLSAAGSVASGVGQSQAMGYEAQMSERAAQYGEIKAQQTSQQMTDRLTQTLGNISAVRASANVGESPTGDAIRNYNELLGDRDRTQAVSNIMAQNQQDLLDAKFYNSMGSSALIGGYLGGFGQMAGAVAKMPAVQNLTW